MFDIVIPLGKGSIWKNNELRFCLRSIQKHCKDFRDIVIIGEKPDWLQNVHHISFDETKGHEGNIWDKVVKACGSNITDDFLFCNDDFFFLKPFSTDYPNYHMGELSAYLETANKISYYHIVERTFQLLKSKELPTLHFDCHRPIVFNKARFMEMYGSLHTGDELIMKSCYANYHRLEGTQIKDVKVGRKFIESLEPYLKHEEMFSIYDSLCGPELFNFLARRFPSKSKFEK